MSTRDNPTVDKTESQGAHEYANNVFNTFNNEPLIDSSLLDNKPNGVLKTEDYTVRQNSTDGAPLFKFGTSNAIKKELMEIKDKPFDDFTEIKQEATVADVFCPSTVTSRSLNHMNLFSHEQMVERMEERESSDPTMKEAIKTIAMNKQLIANRNEVVRIDENSSSVMNQPHDSDTNPLEIKESSETVEVKKKRRTSRTSKPVKNTESTEDSDNNDEPSVKIARSESKKDSDIKRKSNKEEPESASKRRYKKNDMELKCPECEYVARSARAWVMHLREKHSTTPGLAGFALLCDCGHESMSNNHSRSCPIANFTVVRKRDESIRRINDEKVTPQCVMCEMYPATTRAYYDHLRIHHKSSLKEVDFFVATNEIFLLCSCGVEDHYGRTDLKHNRTCDRRLFSLHKLTEK
ncbi:hypothetical protein PENTCL1PPCAC_5597 [Pristionchus entomophagus]|uniref:C2H2-type domain-containing protein n=1 Tax=Pristionchus entomophagus TaxID=358040 RepID=A0AAV5SL41_9BILA|nr:hypothetical protein PENTCL1PPCAC_5597 [Pristionchus entomophagus]